MSEERVAVDMRVVRLKDVKICYTRVWRVEGGSVAGANPRYAAKRDQ